MLKLNKKSALIIASYLNIRLPRVWDVLGGLNGIHLLQTVSTFFKSQSVHSQCTALQKLPFLFWKETGTGLSEQLKHAVSNLLKDCIRGLLRRTLGISQISFESRRSGIRNSLPSPPHMSLGPVETRGCVYLSVRPLFHLHSWPTFFLFWRLRLSLWKKWLVEVFWSVFECTSSGKDVGQLCRWRRGRTDR